MEKFFPQNILIFNYVHINIYIKVVLILIKMIIKSKKNKNQQMTFIHGSNSTALQNVFVMKCLMKKNQVLVPNLQKIIYLTDVASVQHISKNKL